MAANLSETNTRCQLCAGEFASVDLMMVGQTRCCRSCSPSIRNDIALVDHFVDWHQSHKVSDLHITRDPERSEFHPGVFGAICEFELPDIVGSIIMRADGQCDIDAFRVSREESVLCTYAILISPHEVFDYLEETYKKLGREQDGAPNP